MTLQSHGRWLELAGTLIRQPSPFPPPPPYAINDPLLSGRGDLPFFSLAPSLCLELLYQLRKIMFTIK